MQKRLIFSGNIITSIRCSIIILLLLFFSTFSIGQTIYEGRIVNKSSKVSVPFATIGLFKENLGTNANERGEFRLIAKKIENDTLIISCVGYETSKIPVEKLTQNMEIQLEEKKVTLKEIVVNGKYDKSILLNDYSNCGMNWFIGSGSVVMLAQHFRSPSQHSLLKEINLCKFIGDCIFRIRVFNMDSLSRRPSTELTDTIIEVRSRSKHVNINLEKYKIFIPEMDFFVAIEWLYIPFNENKVKSNIGGRKILHSEFVPYLSTIYNEKQALQGEDFFETWQMDYRGKWKLAPGNMQLKMSAKVKYNEF
ncbi:MAG: carboxypeptidase-like regulatory domain-containing protein [Bacteroidetes bacterium]|nr:carboxypeptidase-like regulatory domain-containing protein [Bacteroidota bacterium]